MKRYLRIYKAIIKINVALVLAYRANFINNMLSSFLWGLFNFAWIGLVTHKAKQAFGWNSQELVLLSIGYVLITGLYYSIFAHNFENFSRIVDRGEFDGILLKPIDPQFHISMKQISFGSLSRTISASIFLVWWLAFNHYVVGLAQMGAFLFLLAVGVVMMYAIWFLCITTLIWYPNLGNMTELLYTMNGFARYPSEMLLSKGISALIVFIPISLIVATPMKALIQKNMGWDAVLFIGLSALLFYLSRKFWKYALKHYTSAS